MDLDSILGAAHQRLKEVRKALGGLDALKAEEQKLVRLLKGHKGSSPAAPRGRKAGGGRKGGRPRKNGGDSVLLLSARVLKRHAGKEGMTVSEVLERLRKSNPGRFREENASAALSSALSQALKAKTPKIRVVVKGGPGKPGRYAAF